MFFKVIFLEGVSCIKVKFHKIRCHSWSAVPLEIIDAVSIHVFSSASRVTEKYQENERHKKKIDVINKYKSLIWKLK